MHALKPSILIFLMSAPIWGSPITFDVTALGTLPGGSGSFATGISSNGQVVGYAVKAGGNEAFSFSSGLMTGLGYLGGYEASYATGLNGSGQIVGYGFNDPNHFEAFLYNGGTMTGLGFLGGTYSIAKGINNGGFVVGYGQNGAGNGEAFLYSSGTGMVGLGTLDGHDWSNGDAINNSGTVAGSAQAYPGNVEAIQYSSGVMTGLGYADGYDCSAANAINAAGDIVGLVGSCPAAINGEAFLYSGGVLTGLGYFPGYSYSDAYGINSTNQIVGAAWNSSGTGVGLLFSGGDIYDLNSLLVPGQLANGVILTQALGINDSGQIIADGSDGYAYLLTPESQTISTPEPTGIMLAFTAGSGLFMLRRKRR